MASPFSAALLLALLAIQGEQLIQTDLAWDGAVSTPAFTELAVRVTAGLDANVVLEQSFLVRGYGDPIVIALVAAGLVLVGVFVAIERRVASPMIQLALFRNPLLEYLLPK